MESEETKESCRSACWWLAALLLGALAIRVADFPSRYEFRDVDERGYTQSGLALWEGITPTYKYCPDGPQIWISWIYAAANTACDFLTGTQEKASPFVLRPLVAVNHALFDIYHDWSRLRQLQSAVSVAVALAGIAAAFLLGFKRGGLPAGVILGGLTAAMPMMVDLSVQARPYVMAWSLGLIALYFSARQRPILSPLFMGLAVATRIDMLVLLPLAWADLWPNSRFVRTAVRYTAIAAMTCLLAAPWLLTNLLGNLREIATVRLAEPVGGAASVSQTLLDALILQGLAVPVLLSIAALFLAPPGRTRPRFLAALYVLLLALTMLKQTHFGLRHQGGPIVALIAFSSVGAGAVSARSRAILWAAAALVIVPTAVVSARTVAATRAGYVPAYSTAWVERHVPSGTIVYLMPSLHDPLPTANAAASLWDEVTGPDAWSRKIQSALTRFHVSADDLPRGMSEENMIQDRGNRREWFILGGRPNVPAPRYAIRAFGDSVVFGVLDVPTEFARTGGVVVTDDLIGTMPVMPGSPTIQWITPGGRGARIYCSPDVKLLDADELNQW